MTRNIEQFHREYAELIASEQANASEQITASEQANASAQFIDSELSVLILTDLGPFFVVFSTLARFMMDPFYRAILLSGFHLYKLKLSHVTMLISFIIFTVVLAIYPFFVVDGL